MGHKPQSSPTGMVLYKSADGATSLNVRLQGETVWLTQAQMAELFQTTRANITIHIGNVLNDKELAEDSVCKDYLHTAADGKNYSTKHYNLDMILAVGYRVRSPRGTQFRQWATATLSEYLTKGFVLDDERLKEGRSLGADYFDELLARIRDIRASERRFYQKITDIYATSIDYDANAAMTQEFYATVRNKLHWAITGQTAAEIIVRRADAGKPNLGLTAWKNAPKGPVRKGDVTIAENYLSEKEISELNRIVTMYLDYAEDQAARQAPIHMADWVKKLDGFLEFNERNILRHAGKISAAIAEEHASREFLRFDQARLAREANQPSSDFDRMVSETKRLGKKPPEKKEEAQEEKAPGGKLRFEPEDATARRCGY